MAFKCVECSYTATLNHSVQNHMKWVHIATKEYQCPFLGCKYKSKVLSNFKTHQRQHETIQELRKPFPCKFENCEYRASNKYKLEEHMITKHKPGRLRNFNCPMCPSKFYRKGELKRHISRHTKEKLFRCSSPCRFQASEQSLLSAHIRAVHEKTRKYYFHVKDCQFSTTIHADLTEHLRASHEGPTTTLSFKCNFPQCSFRSTSKWALNRHIDVRHNPNRTRNACCPLCSKKFYSKYVLQNHITNVHTKQACYNCHKCGFTTPYSRDLTVHFHKEHGKGPTFKCASCDYSCYHRYLLNYHRTRAHSEEKRFRCNYGGRCGYETNVAVDLRVHSLIHQKNPEDGFPFACNFPGCDFRRRRKAQIERHKKLHQSSEHRYKCEECPTKCYPNRFSLHFHQCLAHNKSSFKCSMCDYSVSGKYTLAKHVRLHHSQGSVATGRFNDLIRWSGLDPKEHARLPVVLLQKIGVKIV